MWRRQHHPTATVFRLRREGIVRLRKEADGDISDDGEEGGEQWNNKISFGREGREGIARLAYIQRLAYFEIRGEIVTANPI